MKHFEFLTPAAIQLFRLPEGLVKVEDRIEIRNKKNVRVIRYQLVGPSGLDKPHITFVVDQASGILLSFVNRMLPDGVGSFKRAEALEKAKEAFQKIVPAYSRNLSYIRTDIVSRTFINKDKGLVNNPVYWVKFSHTDGSYNWVGITMDGNIEEFEINSLWDFSRMRRKTEMWDNDGWVKARRGLGPELESPNALARS